MGGCLAGSQWGPRIDGSGEMIGVAKVWCMKRVGILGEVLDMKR